MPWELYVSPGKGLAQAKGQEPKGVWLVGNGHTSSSLGCRARRTEVIAKARAALGSTPQRAQLSHSEILIGNGAPLRAFKEKDTISFILGWELLFPGLSGPEQMESLPSGLFERNKPLGRHEGISLDSLPQSS